MLSSFRLQVNGLQGYVTQTLTSESIYAVIMITLYFMSCLLNLISYSYVMFIILWNA